MKDQNPHDGKKTSVCQWVGVSEGTLVMCVVVVVHRDSDVIVWAVINTPGSPSPLPSNWQQRKQNKIMRCPGDNIEGIHADMHSCLKGSFWEQKQHQIKPPRVSQACTCAASYVMVLVSVCTMGTSFVAISVFWAANVSDIVTISVFTTGGWGGREEERERSEGGGKWG